MCQTHGGPAVECIDVEHEWFPQRRICFADMERAAAEWRYDQRHKARPFHDGTFPTDIRKWARERSKTHPYNYRDGVRIWVAGTDVNPHDHFLGGAGDCIECQPDSQEV